MLGDAACVSQPSISRAITKVTFALYRKALREVKMPVNADEIRHIKTAFFRVARMPNTVGLIDCTHVAIKAPKDEEELYINRKNYHSLNVQAVCTKDMKFINFIVNYPGSTHDSFIFTNSTLHGRLSVGEFGTSHLLGEFRLIIFVTVVWNKAEFRQKLF